MDIIAIDFLKVDRAAGGYEYVLVVIDQFTRYAQTCGTTNKSAKTVAQKIFTDFVSKFGIPHSILHDQGKEFENRLFDELQKIFGIKKCRTTPYHPQCNGMVERLNSTLIQMLRPLSEKVKAKWTDSLNKLIYAYNCTRHSVTSFSPYYLLFGRNPRLPIDVMLSTYNGNNYEEPDCQKYTKEWSERMTKAFKIASENTKNRRLSNKKLKDKRATLAPLEIGGRVLVRNLLERGGPGKLRSFWEHKIYIIKEKKDDNGLVYAVVEENKVRGRL